MNPLDDIAKALLAHALALPGVVGGRTGEGGTIPQTPYVEVGDMPGNIDPETAGAGGLDAITPAFVVIFYERFVGSQPEAQKESLRHYWWQMYGRLKDDPTLGGLVDECRVQSWDPNVTERNGSQYWYMALQIFMRWEVNR